MTPDTSKGWSMGAASTTAELADTLRHIVRHPAPRESATLGAAAERLLELEGRIKHLENASVETSSHLIQAGINSFGWNWEGVDKLAAQNAALCYVVEKAAAWDPENTDNADLAALGAYARAALAGKS